MIRAAGLAAALLAFAASGCGGGPAEDQQSAETAPAVSTIDVAALAALARTDKAVLVDVRTPEEFAAGHIAGAVNMPLDTFDPAAVPHRAGKQTVLYCRSGRRSATAADRMAASGQSATHLGGGIVAWQEAGHPVTEATSPAD